MGWVANVDPGLMLQVVQDFVPGWEETGSGFHKELSISAHLLLPLPNCQQNLARRLLPIQLQYSSS